MSGDKAAPPVARRMFLEQAIFGEYAGAHSLLAKSSGAAPFRALIARTDWPSSPPPGTQWQPYESLFNVNGTFVLARTFPDLSASRQGMVLTHALLLAADKACHLSDLRLLERHLLPAPIDRTVLTGELPRIEIESFGVSASEAPVFPRDQRLRILARLLLGTDRKAPVVWLGQDGFWNALVALWGGLWPSARETFAARLSFGPRDVEGEDVTLVATPTALAGRWVGYPLVRQGDFSEEPLTPAECLLAGEAGGSSLVGLLQALGDARISFHDLRLVEQADALLGDPQRTPAKTRSLARLLARLAPSVSDGADLKAQLVIELTRHIRSSAPEDILALANFDDASRAFASGGAISEAIRQWMTEGVYEIGAGPDHDATRMVPVIARALLSTRAGKKETREGHRSDIRSWSEAIADGLAAGLQAAKWSRDQSEALWSWWTLNTALVGPLARMLPDPLPEGMDADLASTAPQQIDSLLARSVSTVARDKGWPLTHAAVVGAALDAPLALAAQLQIAPSDGDSRGLELLADRLGHGRFVLAAIENGDQRAVVVAAKLMQNDLQLLRDLDPTVPAWRAAWLASLQRGHSPLRGIVDQRRVLHALASVTLVKHAPRDKVVIDGLWEHIGASVDKSLVDFPGRRQLWQFIPPTARLEVLAATATGWLSMFVNGGLDSEDLEPELRAAVAGPRGLRHFLLRHGELPTAKVGRIIKLLAQIGSESDFVDWTESVSGYMPTAEEGEQIAGLLLARRWNTAATAVARRALKNGSWLNPAARCATLLPPLWRARVERATTGVPNEGTVWDAFSEVAQELYPRGPAERNVWNRAGGRMADLQADGPGAERWRDAIGHLMRGGRGPKPERLIQEMREDWPDNEALKWMSEVPPFLRSRDKGFFETLFG